MTRQTVPSSFARPARYPVLEPLQQIVACCNEAFRRCFTNVTCHTQVWITSRFHGVNDTIHYLRIKFALPIYGYREKGFLRFGGFECTLVYMS